MNILLCIVAVILLLFALSGFLRGFVRKISGILAFILAGILASAILPSVTTWLRDQTGVYAYVQDRCRSVGEAMVEQTVSSTVNSVLGGQDGSSSSSGGDAAADGGAAAAYSSGIFNQDGSVNRDRIRELLQQNGYDGSVIDSMTDEQIRAYIQQYGGVYAGAAGLPSLLTISVQAAGTDEASASGAGSVSSLLSRLSDSLSTADQRRFIESLPVPESLREQMETFNNSEGYQKLGAETFTDYVINYFAGLITNLIAYLAAWLIAWIIIRIILAALQLSKRIPLIGAADRIGGLILGFAQGLLVIWALFAVIALTSATDAGGVLLQQIYQSPFLELLYNTDIFMRGAASAAAGIL